MKHFVIFTILIGLIFQGCSQVAKKTERPSLVNKQSTSYTFQLSNYLEDNNALGKEVNRIFESMDDTAIVAQLIMPAVGRLGQKKETIDQHIKDRVIGGLVIAVIDNGLGLLSLPAGLNLAVTGGVLLMAATADALSRKHGTLTGR